ncbi:DUF1826 domain-containing protein [Erythrobacter litoralis]|uniref:DUF1826 domain-containing protein n=1 Tax=Erythrobacter litoralis TaxID=39960 RepID=UPI002434E957|nr:DUF1826 domain-containing protein [Erythrobacter litoralis]MDG6077709.1 DUF1826 domain-containing protein [Erythrobacter litoralis]
MFNTAIQTLDPENGAATLGDVGVYRPWEDIRSHDYYLVVEARDPEPLATATDLLLDRAPFSWIGKGSADEALAELRSLPPAIAQDIRSLASRFADLTGSASIRIRLEQIVTNSCRKVHVDYTDLRLITTYAGPGTQVAIGNDPKAQSLYDIPTGHVGLFKGRRYAEGHEPCYHRSPPVGDTGEKRLVLVIDTAVFATDEKCM